MQNLEAEANRRLQTHKRKRRRKNPSGEDPTPKEKGGGAEHQQDGVTFPLSTRRLSSRPLVQRDSEQNLPQLQHGKLRSTKPKKQQQPTFSLPKTHIRPNSTVSPSIFINPLQLIRYKTRGQNHPNQRRHRILRGRKKIINY